MQLNPYLTFSGNCEEAFKAYAKILGAEIVAMIPHEGTPAAASTPTEWRKKIIHARIIGDGFMLIGEGPGARVESLCGRAPGDGNEQALAVRIGGRHVAAVR